MRGATGKTPAWFIWILAVLLLVSAGIAYRIPAHHLKLLGEAPIALPVPLSDFPMQIGGWVGTELSIRATTREYMEENFADDFFSRRYVNSAASDWFARRSGICRPNLQLDTDGRTGRQQLSGNPCRK